MKLQRDRLIVRPGHGRSEMWVCNPTRASRVCRHAILKIANANQWPGSGSAAPCKSRRLFCPYPKEIKKRDVW